MSSPAFLSRIARPAAPQLSRGVITPSSSLLPQHYHQQLRNKHTVRVIVTKDLPEGQKRGVYAGEVHDVTAGYARNYLIPNKMAVYATPANFERCGILDPALAEKAEQKKLMALDDGEEDEDLKAADLLRKYLRNKLVKIKRNVDPNVPNMCHPGHVSAKNLREKLSKQLKIDLEPHETIHISEETAFGVDDMDEKEIMAMLAKMYDESEEGEQGSKGGETADAVEGEVCNVKIKQLGDYMAKITLAGGYVVPLRFLVEKR